MVDQTTLVHIELLNTSFHKKDIPNFHKFLFNQVFEGKKLGVQSQEYQVFLWIFQKNSAMATLDLKEMGDSQLGKLFSLPSQKNFPISFKQKVAIAKFV